MLRIFKFKQIISNLGQPSSGLGFCAYQSLADSKWGSDNCSQNKPFVCEYNQVQTTKRHLDKELQSLYISKKRLLIVSLFQII